MVIRNHNRNDLKIKKPKLKTMVVLHAKRLFIPLKMSYIKSKHNSNVKLVSLWHLTVPRCAENPCTFSFSDERIPAPSVE